MTGDPCVLDRWLWVRKHLRGGPLRTFDAGAGNGAFSIYAAREGNRVLAASFSDEEMDSARRRAQAFGAGEIEFRKLDLRELERHLAELGTFDQIICLETIEHVLDDAGLIASLARMLSRGGRLLLSTPFEGHRPLYTEERHPQPVEDGSHVRYGYTAARLRELAAGAGLQVADEGFVSGVVSQKVTDLMRWLTGKVGRPLAWLAILPLRPLVLVDRPLTALLGYPYLSVAMCGVNAAPAGSGDGGAVPASRPAPRKRRPEGATCGSF